MSCDYGGIEVINDTNTSPFYFEASKYQQNKNKEIMTKMDENKMKNKKYNFAYIDNNNPKPCKRQKLCHYNERITILNAINIDTKPKKLIASIPNSKLINSISNKTNHQHNNNKIKKGEILHHCTLIERWNMLTSKKKKNKSCKESNLPILSLLNEITPKQQQNQYQSQQNDQYESPQSIHYHSPKKTQSINYSDSDTDSLSSYQSAYNYFDNDNLPTMSINEPLDIYNNDNDGNMIQTVQNYYNDQHKQEHHRSIFQQAMNNNKDKVDVNYLNPNNPWNHDINTNINNINACNPQSIYNAPNITGNSNKTSYDFKWNINDHNDRIQIEGQSKYSEPAVSINNMSVNKLNMNMNINDSTEQKEWSKDGTDYFYKIIRGCLYALIIYLMFKFNGYQFGVSFFPSISICNMLNIGIMCEDDNGNLKLMEKGDDGDMNNFMYNKEWFYFLKWIILTIIIAISMCYCLMKGDHDKNKEQQFRFKYDQNENNMNTNSNINYFNHQHVTVNNHYHHNFVFNK